ncbi:lysozyme inhibitor LprI family protein [Ornithinibacillus californiensis]|uniref:lysozyme inhibitor LprI family protein n=1 Tax=Ornithinibacillus californiensis TaxID=161536 RepID=UPI00069E45B9|nr:lysozyme inhibitor LprI family protein [Ornithinibacillus californiensis]
MRKLLMLIVPFLLLVGCTMEEPIDETPVLNEKEEETTEEHNPNVVTKEDLLQQLDEVEESLALQRELINTGTQADMDEAIAVMHQKWDEALNEVYAVLQEQLSSEEMEDLREEQREWIKLRDKEAEREAEENRGGTVESFAYTAVLMEMTKERCYELVEENM